MTKRKIESVVDSDGKEYRLTTTQCNALESEAITRVYEQMSATQEDY